MTGGLIQLYNVEVHNYDHYQMLLKRSNREYDERACSTHGRQETSTLNFSWKM
jgi:hypothetical protein